jgi:hypothetical protein
MWWLWIVGPFVAALVYLLTDWRDRRREVEVERWRAAWGGREEPVGGYRDTKKAKGKAPGAKRVTSMPGPLARMLLSSGGGARLDYFELVPKLAYLASMGGDAMNASDHVTVVAKLDEAGPMLTARPLPILDGQREPNNGVQFKKDPDFMEQYIVERSLEEGAPVAADEATDKPIRKWLSPAVRAALLDLPDAWLRVEGRAMALTLYGPVDADRIDQLLAAADIVFAEYGADGGPSLLGEDDEEPEAEPAKAAPVPAKKKGGGGKKPGAAKPA